MKSSRRWAAALATASLTALTLGCTAAPGDPAEGVDTIRVVIAEYSKENTAAYWDQFTETFKDRTGITAEVQIINWNDIDQQTSTMIQTGNAPDILHLNKFASYAAEDLLYSADEVLPEEVVADIFPAFVESGSYDGNFYGFPAGSGARALFYNKDLFAQAGIDAPPTTWTEFVDAAEKITALGDGTVGYAQPLGPEEAQAEFAIWLFNNGGAFKDGQDWVLDSPESVDTLEFLRSLSVEDGVTQPNPGRTNRTDGAFPLFQQGKAGMVVGFGPLSRALDADNPDIDYGIAPMPAGDGADAATLGVADYIMGFKKPGNEEAVRAFFELFYEEDQLNAWVKAEGFLPVQQSALPLFAGDEANKVYLDSLPGAKLAPVGDPMWDKVSMYIQQNIGLAVEENGDPAAFLDALQALAEAR